MGWDDQGPKRVRVAGKARRRTPHLEQALFFCPERVPSPHRKSAAAQNHRWHRLTEIYNLPLTTYHFHLLLTVPLTIHCSLLTAHSSQLIAHCSPPTAHSSLHVLVIDHCSLLATHHPLLTTDCTLHTAHCTLHATHHSSLTTHHTLRYNLLLTLGSHAEAFSRSPHAAVYASPQHAGLS